MLVKVTASDIRIGKKKRGDRCPLQRAISRAVGYPMKSKNVIVGRREYAITPDVETMPYKWHYLPDCATQFLISFDNGGPVEAFDFNLDIQIDFANDLEHHES